MKKIECNLTIGNDFIFIKSKPSGECLIQMSGQQFTAQELAAANVIAQTLRCLQTGRPIDHYFNPTVNDSDEQKIVKCEWLRSGKLTVRDMNASKRHKHADTVEQALERQRVFTCMFPLFRKLPRRRLRIEG